MLTPISCSHLFVLDQDAALDFYVNTLGLHVHTDADLGFMRWLTVCVPGEPGRQILLEKHGPLPWTRRPRSRYASCSPRARQVAG